MRRVLVYGDVNLGIIDGSAIWLTSISEVLSEVFDEVHVLLKTVPENRRLIRSIESIGNVFLHDPKLAPPATELDPRRAAQNISGLSGEIDPEVILIRGLRVAHFASRNEAVASRLWSYITDLPFPLHKASDRSISQLQNVVKSSHRVFAQTEEARSFLESICPEAAGKTHLLLPMVPAATELQHSRQRRVGLDPLRMVYSGKFAREWRTLEMLEIPVLLRERGVEAELVMIGDKFQANKEDPEWANRMRVRLTELSEDPESGVQWAGGMGRSEALSLMKTAHIGLGWRARDLESSLEISTKMLEYSMFGVPPLINRSEAHERLYGKSYPLMLNSDSIDDVLDLLVEMDPGRIDAARDAARDAVRPFGMDAAAERFKKMFRRPGAPEPGAVSSSSKRKKVVIASHDFKFMGEIIDFLKSSDEFELEIDLWSSLRDHDEKISRDLLQAADIVICEWCGPNAVWYAENKRPGQKLVVRLHAFETRGPWMRNLDYSKIDHLVFVSEYQKELSRTLLGFPDDVNCIVIPNSVDTQDFDRPKVPGSEFHLGVLGIVSMNKRPDRALDLMEELLRVDSRYILHIKGRMPWEYEYEWNRPVQRHQYLDFFGRIRSSQTLRNSVVFEPFGPDVASWFRKVGVILSPSFAESFHMAVAEGMASGALPVIWDRPGAREIFSDRFVHDDISAMARSVLSLRQESARDTMTREVKLYASRWDVHVVMKAWRDMLGEEHRRI